jgi:exopolysaccharide biosynthesis polyprenyl glycosylphosphotransferase
MLRVTDIITNHFLCYLAYTFFITYSFRVVVTTRTNRKIQTRKIGFNTLLIGSNEKALDLYKNIMNNKISSGHKFVGFVNIYEKDNYCLCEYMPHLGSVDNLKNIIKEHQIEDIIIAVESQEHKELERVITKTEGESVIIKAIPDNCDILTGKVKIDALFDEPLVPISHELMPQWQMNFKRFMDVSVSVFVLVFFFPLYLFLAFGVKFSSPGPIFYSHYRVGKRGEPFKIFKFRSMRIDAEADGPALSSENDPRITNFGKFLRKMRLDEIPQFYNVLIGDMSLVGPRPERQFFIDQIVVKAPHYSHLLRVRPGITSWGQVKYGYAKDVDEMVQRLKYDIIYIENMSIYIDIKILIYTIRTVLLAKGL